MQVAHATKLVALNVSYWDVAMRHAEPPPMTALGRSRLALIPHTHNRLPAHPNIARDGRDGFSGLKLDFDLDLLGSVEDTCKKFRL